MTLYILSKAKWRWGSQQVLRLFGYGYVLHCVWAVNPTEILHTRDVSLHTGRVTRPGLFHLVYFEPGARSGETTASCGGRLRFVKRTWIPGRVGCEADLRKKSRLPDPKWPPLEIDIERVCLKETGNKALKRRYGCFGWKVRAHTHARAAGVKSHPVLYVVRMASSVKCTVSSVRKSHNAVRREYEAGWMKFSVRRNRP